MKFISQLQRAESLQKELRGLGKKKKTHFKVTEKGFELSYAIVMQHEQMRRAPHPRLQFTLTADFTAHIRH